jgi:hypothetical protein
MIMNQMNRRKWLISRICARNFCGGQAQKLLLTEGAKLRKSCARAGARCVQFPRGTVLMFAAVVLTN